MVYTRLKFVSSEAEGKGYNAKVIHVVRVLVLVCGELVILATLSF